MGLRHFGVPPGGPFDRESHALANALLGNASDAVCVEMAMAAGRLVATEPVEIGFAGATCALTVDGASVMSPVISLQTGQELQIAAPTLGARLYLSLPGGVTSESLKRGGQLRANGPNGHTVTIQELGKRPKSLSGAPLRAIPFGDSALLTDLAACQTLKVRLDSDRVGIRLEGIRLDPGPERPSEPACPGAIQVTNDGSLIILGPDGPTIGGYRKIGVVCSADLGALGQLRPGGEVLFQEVTRDMALDSWRGVGKTPNAVRGT